MRIAVIGTGISGSLVARLLAARSNVTVFEASDQPGGHARTVDVDVDGRSFPVDVGFMVFNRQTYPNFCRLLQLLEIASQPSDMSFSVTCARSGLEYQGSSLNGLFAQRRNVLRPSFLRMLADILRFNHRSAQALAREELRDSVTVGEFLEAGRFSKPFLRQYLVPMAAAIWSSDPRAILDFPAHFLVSFFANHGLIQLRKRPQWRTIAGGSRTYVRALLEPLRKHLRLSSPVLSVRRGSDGALVETAGRGRERFDHVVFAAHADQTLRLLADATPNERIILGAFPYQENPAVLHTDTRLLPRLSRAWASWNYLVPQEEERAASVTYDLSRLQRHDSSTPMLLTLNPARPVEPAKVIDTFTFHHPAYSRSSITAQQRWSEISGQRNTHFCGAYWGYGFHEDGVNSALRVAQHFGLGLEACTVASLKERYRTSVALR